MKILNSYLFVYGTLMQPFEQALQKRFANKVKFIGKAYVYGQLFLVDWYPALLLHQPYISQINTLTPFGNKQNNKQPITKVFGELYAIDEQILTPLDRYEGIDDKLPQPHEYQRVQTWVTLFESFFEPSLFDAHYVKATVKAPYLQQHITPWQAPRRLHQLSNNKRLCWIYIYQWTTGHLTPISSGCFSS